MSSKNLAIAEEITASSLSDIVLSSFQSVSLETQEMLLQSKNEQTFSGLLAASLQDIPSVKPGSAFARVGGNWDRYRHEGLEGISNLLSLFERHYKSPVVLKSATVSTIKVQGFIDMLCVEVKG